MRARALSRNVVANVANAGAGIAASVVSIPLILHHVGQAGLGTWTLAQTILLYIATAETGVGPAIQRHVSVAYGAGDVRAASRVIWSGTAFYVALGVVAAVAAYLLAPTLVTVFDVRADLRADARTMFRLTGPVMVLALIGAGQANVLQAVERFTGAAVATVVSALAFLGVAAVLLADGRGLVGLVEAALVQYGVGVLLRTWLTRDLLAAAPFGRLRRDELGAIAGFSLRMQVNVVSTLVNSQTDKVVVGLLAGTAAVAQVGIGSQVAEAQRFLVFAALGPLIARMAISQGRGDPAALARLYRELDPLWRAATIGFALVVCGAMHPLIAAWLGPGYGDAVRFGVILTVAYGINALTGPGVAYLRALARPGLEARYGLLVIGLNVAGSVALGLAFGPTGVVAATTVAYLAGTGWFLARLRAVGPAGDPEAGRSLPAVVLRGLLAGALTLGWGELALAATPRPVAVVLVAAGACVALAGYLRAVGADRLRALAGD